MLVFLCATYNEEAELEGLLSSITPAVDAIVIADDGSTDDTKGIAYGWADNVLCLQHTGLPETVKAAGVRYINEEWPNAWVLMLDADERIDPFYLARIKQWVATNPTQTHVWFEQDELLDGQRVRHFVKCKLFRPNAVLFSNSIHIDDQFTGQGVNFGWRVVHRKTAAKQRLRETEYIETYKKLVAEDKASQQWVDFCKSMHYFVKE